jgi:hypothetical protein
MVPLSAKPLSDSASGRAPNFHGCRFGNGTSLRVGISDALFRRPSIADAAGKTLEVVVVSLDPRLDTPESWRNYRDMHNIHYSNWHFLTTDQASTTRLAKQLGWEYWRYDEHVMHSLRIVRISPNGNIATSLHWRHRDTVNFLIDLPQTKN